MIIEVSSPHAVGKDIDALLIELSDDAIACHIQRSQDGEELFVKI